MNTGARGGTLAFFFVLGMAFMAAIFLLANPQWSEHERVRVVKEEAAPQVVRVRVPVAPPAPLEVEEILEKEPEEVPKARTAPVKKIELKEPEVVVTPAEVAPLPVLPENRPVGGPLNPHGLVAQASGRIGSGNVRMPAVLRGRAVLVGKPPAELVIPLDPSCESIRKGDLKTRFYRIDAENGLADVVVEVAGFPKRSWPRPLEAHVITYRQCLIEPYISVMQAGQKLMVENGDSIPHGLHAMPASSQGKNMLLLPRQRQLEVRLGREDDFVRVKCDIHNWEFAYIAILDHPFFAVTDAEGKFEIKGLPKGKYTVRASHRKADAERAVPFEIGEEGADVELRLRVGQ